VAGHADGLCLQIRRLGPVGDHTLCAVMNDLRGRRVKTCQPDAVQTVSSGPFGPQIGRRIPMKYPNELPTASDG
jgi:hypothetical protein